MNEKTEKKGPATASTFVEELRKQHGLSTAQAKDITNTFLQTMEQNLKNNRDILLNRIGSIRVYAQEERVSVIPKTGQRILLNERRLIKFDPSPVIQRELNEGSGNPRTYKELTEEEAKEYIQKHKNQKKK